MAIPTPVPQGSYDQIFDMSEENRIAYMKSLGAKNLDPPLPHSSHLKNRTTGVIYPWCEELAEQGDIMVCCDADGDENPDAWGPTVMPDFQEADKSELLAQARADILVQASKVQGKFQVDFKQPDYTPDGGFPQGVMSFDDLDKLTARVKR